VSGRSLDRPGRNQGDNYDGLDASGVFVLLSATFSPDGQSRSAARTRFPVFDSVVALTKESGQELSPARPDLDVRVMVWAPTALVPVPFLRMTHTPGGDLEASGFAWWLRSSDVAPTDGRLTPDGAHPAGTLLLLVHDLYGAIADRPTELLRPDNNGMQRPAPCAAAGNGRYPDWHESGPHLKQLGQDRTANEGKRSLQRL
jgi:hypothetical protein